jgi:hypothetical protein
MKTETRTMYVARDGAEFKTEALCRAYERRTAGASLVGLTKAQVEAAQSGADPELAETFRQFVNEMRNIQRRRPNGAEAAPNNGGDDAGPPLSADADDRRADDSAKRTDHEHAMNRVAAAPAAQGEGIGLEDERTEAAP